MQAREALPDGFVVVWIVVVDSYVGSRIKNILMARVNDYIRLYYLYYMIA